jgi:hypothetical protein
MLKSRNKSNTLFTLLLLSYRERHFFFYFLIHLDWGYKCTHHQFPLIYPSYVGKHISTTLLWWVHKSPINFLLDSYFIGSRQVSSAYWHTTYNQKVPGSKPSVRFTHLSLIIFPSPVKQILKKKKNSWLLPDVKQQNDMNAKQYGSSHNPF